MSAKKHIVKLSEKQRRQLKRLSKRGKVHARTLNHARILLLADENRPKGSMTDAEITEILDTSQPTVVRVRKRFVTEGLDAAIKDKPRSGRPPKFSGKQRAEITALACSQPLKGRNRWSMRLMADRLVELEFVDTISHQTVFNVLKKTNFPRISKNSGVSES